MTQNTATVTATATATVTPAVKVEFTRSGGIDHRSIGRALAKRDDMAPVLSALTDTGRATVPAAPEQDAPVDALRNVAVQSYLDATGREAMAVDLSKAAAKAASKRGASARKAALAAFTSARTGRLNLRALQAPAAPELPAGE